MIEGEIAKKCPEIYEKLKSLGIYVDWNEAFSHLEKLNWLLPPESILHVLQNAFKLIDDVSVDRFSIIKLDAVKFHINSLVFNLSTQKKNLKRFADDFSELTESMSFFRTHYSVHVTMIEPLFCLISELINTCFMHIEAQFLSTAKKSISQHLNDLFYNAYISPVLYDLSQTQKGTELINKYPKPRYIYIPYFSKVPNITNRYYGEYKKNLKHGFGLQSFTNGDFYKGEFFEGQMQGKGLYFWSHGGVYEGEFKNGHINGFGTEYYSSGNTYTGDFINGKKHGRGEMKFSSGDKYIGEWKDNYMEGEGEYFWSSGVVYKGWFAKDRRHGKGEITMDNGQKYDLEWDYDELV